MHRYQQQTKKRCCQHHHLPNITYRYQYKKKKGRTAEDLEQWVHFQLDVMAHLSLQTIGSSIIIINLLWPNIHLYIIFHSKCLNYQWCGLETWQLTPWQALSKQHNTVWVTEKDACFANHHHVVSDMQKAASHVQQELMGLKVERAQDYQTFHQCVSLTNIMLFQHQVCIRQVGHYQLSENSLVSLAQIVHKISTRQFCSFFPLDLEEHCWESWEDVTNATPVLLWVY